jgi:hypothetical protein
LAAIKPYFAGRRSRFVAFENHGGVTKVRLHIPESSMVANRNVLYLIIGALVVAIGVLGYNLYEAKKEPKGMQINLGPDGLKIQSK